MDHSFQDFCACIYTNEAELRRFRKLLVHAVLAADIFDRELKKNRWEKAFARSDSNTTPEDVNRMATNGFEHLMQALRCFAYHATLDFLQKLFIGIAR